MAPERLMGGSLRKPSDVYSFGMVIYEAIVEFRVATSQSKLISNLGLYQRGSTRTHH